MRNIFKIIALTIVAIGSLEMASSKINDLVREVSQREQTITDAIVKTQVQNTFSEVEKHIEEVSKEENIEIITEKVEMKPPIPEKKEEIDIQEEIIQEEEIEEILPEEVQKLSLEEIEQLGKYLVDNYFLDGYKYSREETDELIKERKTLVSDMESYVIASLDSVFRIVTDIGSVTPETVDVMILEASKLLNDFELEFNQVSELGDEFDEIYSYIVQYFNRYIVTLEQMNVTMRTMKDTPNQNLAITIMMKELNEVIIPGMKQVMNAGFELKEKTNQIYLEGNVSKKLLTVEEVISAIKNPKGALNG